MRYLRFIRSVPIGANVLVTTAIAVLLLKMVVLDQIAEAFPGAHRLGVVVDGLLVSVIASYIFYLIVVHLKQRTDAAIVYPYISRHSSRIVGECKGQLIEISKASGVDLDLSNVSKDLLTSAFSKLQPYSDAPLIVNGTGRHATWLQYLEYHNTRTKSSIRRLLDQILFLQAEHVRLITNVDDCAYFTFSTTIQQLPLKNSDMGIFGQVFYDYCVLCRELDLYNTAK